MGMEWIKLRQCAPSLSWRSRRSPYDLDGTNFAHCELYDALVRIAGVGGKINTKTLGRWLANHEDRIVGDLKFIRHPTPDHTGVVRWAVVKG